MANKDYVSGLGLVCFFPAGGGRSSTHRSGGLGIEVLTAVKVPGRKNMVTAAMAFAEVLSRLEAAASLRESLANCKPDCL